MVLHTDRSWYCFSGICKTDSWMHVCLWDRFLCGIYRHQHEHQKWCKHGAQWFSPEQRHHQEYTSVFSTQGRLNFSSSLWLYMKHNYTEMSFSVLFRRSNWALFHCPGEAVLKACLHVLSVWPLLTVNEWALTFQSLSPRCHLHPQVIPGYAMSY